MAANTEFRRGDSDNDLLRKILTKLGLIAASDGSSSEAMTVRGAMAVASTAFTRPNNATPYSVNDVVGVSPGAVMEFTNVARITGGTGYITNVRLIKSTTTTASATFRLWLYSVAPTAIADHAQFTLLYANRANRLGYVDLACSTEGTGSDSASALVLNVNLKFSCAAGSKSIYGVLEAKQAYTPGAQENFWVELTADQN